MPAHAGRTAAAAAAAIAGEAVVLLAAFSTDVPPAAVLVLHALTLAVVGTILLVGRSADEDTAVPAMVFFAIAVAGPAGAVAALASLPFQGALGRGPATLEDWYDRLANAGSSTPSAALLDRIASGRVQRPEAPLPQNYLQVIENGTLEERQRALGLIARQFHPDYAPVLEAALRSPEPVVRVQASAVVARVREDLKSRMAKFAFGGGPIATGSALKTVSELQSLQSCALLDGTLRGRCRDHLHAILARLLAGNRSVTRAVSRADRGGLAAIETYLIREQRFKDLRVGRRVARITSGSALRLRRLPLRSSAA